MADKEWSPTNILDVFGDRIARATLVIANQDPVAVKEIAEVLDVSDPTVYRRIDPLVEANLLAVSTRVDENGNQHKVYETILDEVTFAIEGDTYAVDVQVDQGLSDNFGDLWSDLESSDPAPDRISETKSSTVELQGDPS